MTSHFVVSAWNGLNWDDSMTSVAGVFDTLDQAVAFIESQPLETMTFIYPIKRADTFRDGIEEWNGPISINRYDLTGKVIND